MADEKNLASNPSVQDKDDGRAEVIGGKKGRSKLALPGLPAFSFPKLSSPSN